MPFSVTQNRVKEIAKSLDANVAKVEQIQKMFSTWFLKDGIGSFSYQYLAHLIRSMEAYLADFHKNPRFRIDVTPLPTDDPVIDVETAQYYTGSCFLVYFNPKMETKQLRVCLAHELGHLFLASCCRLDDHTAFPPEPCASIFGILAILEKNQFYANGTRNIRHASFEAVVQDFELMANKKNNIYNLSGT